MENDLRKSRQKIGIERVKKLGKKYGGHDFLTEDQKDKIIQLREKGLSYRKIKELVNVGLGSISRVLKEVA